MVSKIFFHLLYSFSFRISGRNLLVAFLVISAHQVNSQNFTNAFKIGNTGFDEGRGIVTDAAGNIYITGYFSGTADFDPGAGTANLTSSGDYEIYLAKYNSSGVYQWAFKIGNTLKDAGFGVALDAFDNIYVTGYFQGTADFDPGAGAANLTSSGLQDIFIAKYNSSGVYQWANKIGNTGNDLSLKMDIDGSDNILITGAFNGTVDFDPGAGTSNLISAGSDDIFVAKYNSSGIYQWAFNIGSASSDMGYGLDADDAGNVYITGWFQGTADFDPGAGIANLTSAGTEDIFAARYNSSGIYQWAFNIGAASNDNGYGIATDGNGNVCVTGKFQGTADFDPGPGLASLTSVGSEDIFLAGYNSSGVYQWAFNIGGAGVDNGIEIGFDGNGGIYITGYFAGTADFDPSAGTANLTSSGNTDIYLAKYNSTGNYQWAFNAGNTGGDVGRELFLDGEGSLFVTGYFEVSPDFDPSCGTATLTSSGNFDVFAAEYSVASLASFTSGFESCEAVFCYDGIQVPINSTSSPRSGTNHGEINGGCAGGTAGCYDGSIITPLLSFVPGCAYTVKVYAKNAIAAGNLTIAKATSPTNAAIKAAAGSDIIMASTAVSSAAYTLYKASFTVSSPESKYIGFQMFRAGTGGTAGAQLMIDDIVITKNDCGHCSNGIPDADETGIDCGGTDCSSSVPVGGTVSPASLTLACGSGNFSLSLCGHTGIAQWQFSPDNFIWYDLPEENASSLKGAVTNTSYFRAKLVSDGCNPTPAYSNSAAITITGTTDNTWLTTGTSSWGTAANWSAGVVPTNCHNVTIPSGGIQPAISAAAQCNDLTILVGATLTQTTGAGANFDIYGDLTNNGTFNYSASSTSPRLFGGINFLGGTGTFNAGARYLLLQANSNYMLSSGISLGGIDVQPGAIINLQSYGLACTQDFQLTGNFYANSGTLELQNTATITTSNTNWGTGTFYLNVNGNNSLSIVDDYYNIRIANSSGNSTSMAANITATNDFIIDNLNTTVSGSSFSITLGGDFTNNGIFTASTGTVIFNGSDAQNIGGTSATAFRNLTINNTSSSGVTLNQPVSISGTLTLTDGNLYSSSANILALSSGSSLTPAGGSAASFVDGPVKKIGATAFAFPTGDNNRWRRIEITAPGVLTDEFVAEYRFNPYGTYNIENTECSNNELKEVSSAEYWFLDRTAGTSTPQVTLYWEDAAASNITDCPDLQIAHYDAVNSWWENNQFNSVTVSGSCAGNGAGSIQTNTGVAEFGSFTFGSKSKGLPNSFEYGCPATDLYWVGGNGNWNVSSNWSATSGGAGGAGIPDINTNVIVDNSSGTSVITLPAGTWYTRSFTMSGAGAKSTITGTGILLPRP